jgi:DtxR family Mn-dependent transcriptional regulator
VTRPTGSLSAQDYLAAIYEMAEEHLPTVQAAVARWMGVSPASVSEAVKRLRRDGMLTASDRELRLSDAGQQAARSIVRKHRLAERFLVEVLGLPWYQAHGEAEVWQNAISEPVEARIVEMLDDPATCVHGNPIPGSKRRIDQSDLRPLREFEIGETVQLERLTEDLELDTGVMKYFEEGGLMPGATITVRDVAPDGTMTLKVAGHQVGLGAHLTDNLWVRRGDGHRPRTA